MMKGVGSFLSLLGTMGLTFLLGDALIPGMTPIALVLLLGGTFLFWAGLLLYLEGLKNDIATAIRDSSREE